MVSKQYNIYKESARYRIHTKENINTTKGTEWNIKKERAQKKTATETKNIHIIIAKPAENYMDMSKNHIRRKKATKIKNSYNLSTYSF